MLENISCSVSEVLGFDKQFYVIHLSNQETTCGCLALTIDLGEGGRL